MVQYAQMCRKGGVVMTKNPVLRAFITLILISVMVTSVTIAEPNTTEPVVNAEGNSSQNISNFGQITKQGEWIYFTNSLDEKKLYKMKIDGSNMTLLCNDEAWYINVVGDWIYYSNFSDECKFYKIKIDGSQRTKISDEAVSSIYAVGNIIYYSAFLSADKGTSLNAIYKMNIDGSQKTKITVTTESVFSVVGDWVYYTDGLNLAKIKIDGTKKTTILKDCLPYEMNVVGDWIYFGNYSDHFNLYKIKADGSGKKKLSNVRVQQMYVIGDWVYYTAEGYSGVFRVKLDGSITERPAQLSDINNINVIDDWIFAWDEWHRPFKMKLDLSNKQRIDGVVIGIPADNTKEILASGVNNQGNTSANINNEPFAAQQGDWLFYSADNKGDILVRQKTDGSNTSHMTFGDFYYVNVKGEYLYYYNGVGLAKRKLNGTGETQLTEDWGSQLTVVGDWIYYVVYDENIGERLYRVKTDGKDKKLLSDHKIGESYFIDGDWIYYCNLSDSHFPLYKVKLDGTGRTKVNNFYYRKMIISNNSIYYINGYSNDKGRIFVSNMDGSSKVKISDDVASYFNINGDWLYYTNASDGDKLYKIKLDGTEKTKMTDNTALAPSILGDWIFYFGNGYKYDLDYYEEKYRIKLDGTDNQRIQ